MMRAKSISTFLSCLAISASCAAEVTPPVVGSQPVTSTQPAVGTQTLMGINLPTAAYNGRALPGRHGYDYLWPNKLEIQRFAAAGFKVMRIAFLWERMQPVLNGPLSENEIKNLDIIVNAARDAKVTIVIDPHNFGFYRGNKIGSESVTDQHFYDLWYKLASRYKTFPNVIFGLMNEPNKQTTTEWAKIAQVGVSAVRDAGATQLILVPGARWSGAHTWTAASLTAPSNGEALLKVRDPLNNVAYEMHGYLDKDSSGTSPECVSEDVGIKRFSEATKWLKQNRVKGFVGELGVANNPTCLAALDNFMKFLVQNNDVWMGFTYWSASKWGGRYMYDVYSLDPEKQPQYGVIKKYLQP